MRALAIDSSRLDALEKLRFRDGQIEAVLDSLAEITARALGAPLGLLSVAGGGLLLSRGGFGWDAGGLPAEIAFCTHAMAFPDEPTVVDDASVDPRFSGDSLVTGPSAIRFFAGAALRNPGGAVIGVLCVLGGEPRALHRDQRELLLSFARHAEMLFRLRMGRMQAVDSVAVAAAAEQTEHDQLLSIVSASIDLTSFVDPGYVYRYVNPTYLDYWQLAREDIVGRAVPDILGEAVFLGRVKPLLDRALAGELVGYEAAFDFPGKGRRRTQVTYAPALDRYGAIVGVAVAIRDAEELKRGDDRLGAIVKELEEAQRVSQVGSWDWDPASGRLNGSREFFRLFDADDPKFSSFDAITERLHPADRAGFERMLQVATADARAFGAEFRLRLSDGGYRHLQARGQAHLDGDGAVMRVVGTCQDISERKAAERALRESDELNLATFEQAAVGIAHVGTDGAFLRVNDRLCRIVGYPREDLLRLTFQQITYPDDLDADLDFVRRVVAGEMSNYSMEKRYFHRDGSLVWVNLTVSLVRDAIGMPMHFIAIVEDIGSRKRAELDLEAHRIKLARTVDDLQDRTVALQRFIYILSHDMREPLNTIINFAGLLAEHPALAVAPERCYVDYLSTGAARLKMLLDDLLRYVQIDFSELRDLEVDLSEIFNHVRSDLAAQIQLSGAKVDAMPLPVVRGDPSLIRVVLQNLVSNAIKFVAPGVIPAVVVSEESVDTLVWRLAVRDNGIGISADALAALFTPFTRLNSRDSYAGSGLGLATCRRIAEMHGGQMDISSVPRQGSCFSLVLPRRRS